MLVVAFAPESLGNPIAEGSRWTVGVTLELFLFVFFWVTTVIYVRRANTEFDTLSQEIVRDAWKEEK